MAAIFRKGALSRNALVQIIAEYELAKRGRKGKWMAFWQLREIVNKYTLTEISDDKFITDPKILSKALREDKEVETELNASKMVVRAKYVGK